MRTEVFYANGAMSVGVVEKCSYCERPVCSDSVDLEPHQTSVPLNSNVRVDVSRYELYYNEYVDSRVCIMCDINITEVVRAI